MASPAAVSAGGAECARGRTRDRGSDDGGSDGGAEQATGSGRDAPGPAGRAGRRAGRRGGRGLSGRLQRRRRRPAGGDVGGAQASKAPVTVAIAAGGWVAESDKAVHRQVWKAFAKARPHVTLDINEIAFTTDKLLTSVAGGTPPDVAYIHPNDLPAVAGPGAYQNLDKYVKRDKSRRPEGHVPQGAGVPQVQGGALPAAVPLRALDHLLQQEPLPAPGGADARRSTTGPGSGAGAPAGWRPCAC